MFILSFGILSVISIQGSCILQSHKTSLSNLATLQTININERFNAGVLQSEFEDLKKEALKTFPNGTLEYQKDDLSGYKAKLCFYKNRCLVF